jgi:hypothetical protein
MKKIVRSFTHFLTGLFDYFSLRPALEDRVESALYSLEKEFERLKAQAPNPKAEWISNVESILKDAKSERTKDNARYFPAGQRETFWNYIHLMEQHMVWGLNEEELKAKAKALRAEAKKLGGSRADAILEILGRDENNKLTQEALYKAVRIRDDHYNTKYHKISLRRASLRTLAFLLAVVVVLGICWMYNLRTGDEQRTLLFWEEAISGLFLGALGASFSMAYTLTASSLDMKIPDQIMGAMITFIRLSIGGTAAFITLLLFKSGVLDAFLSDKLLKSQYGFFIAAFIAGFSERWIVNVVQVLAKEKEQPAAAK